MRVAIIADAKPLLGEDLLWDVGHQRLYWVDSLAPVYLHYRVARRLRSDQRPIS